MNANHWAIALGATLLAAPAAWAAATVDHSGTSDLSRHSGGKRPLAIRRAVILGSPTFGDASTRSAIPLSDGSTLSLTMTPYLTPKNHPITGHGIVPDVAAAAAPPGTVARTDPQMGLASEVTEAASILEPGAGAARARSRSSPPSGVAMPRPEQ